GLLATGLALSPPQDISSLGVSSGPELPRSGVRSSLRLKSGSAPDDTPFTNFPPRLVYSRPRVFSRYGWTQIDLFRFDRDLRRWKFRRRPVACVGHNRDCSGCPS